MNIVIYIAATLVGLLLSYVGVVFAMLSGRQFAYVIGGLLAAAHIGTFIFVRRRAIQGKGRSAAIVLVLPIFVVMGAVYVFEVTRQLLIIAWPNSSEFTAACQNAGAQYYKPPTAPVRSIAYDLRYKYQPSHNYFKILFGNRIELLQYRNYPHPASIEFTERVYMRNRAESTLKYFRLPRQGMQYSIDGYTADALVEYQIRPAEELRKGSSMQGMMIYELTVTDRRDGEKLGFLRYVIDAKNKRGCGLTESRVMDERAFILKAIGARN